MKSLWVTLAVFLLLVPLVSGNWYAPRCANKKGRCRTKCRTREMAASPTVGSCGQKKTCCIKRDGSAPTFCSETTKATNSLNTVSQAAGGTPGAVASPSAAATTTTATSAAAAAVAVASTTTTPASAGLATPTTTSAAGAPLRVASSTASSAAAASAAASAAAAASASSAGAAA